MSKEPEAPPKTPGPGPSPKHHEAPKPLVAKDNVDADASKSKKDSSKELVAVKASKKAPSGARTLTGVAVGVAVVGTVASELLVPEVRAAGIAANVGIALGLFAFTFAAGALVVRRNAPRKLGLGAIGALVGALACASTGAIAYASRAPGKLPVNAGETGMTEWIVGEAQARAQSAAWFGLVGVPGILLGALGVWLAVRARKNARAAAPPLNVGVESIPAAWAALASVSLVALAGTGVDVFAITANVALAPHPHLPLVRSIGDSLHRADLQSACTSLEQALDPQFLPSDILEHELPSYRETANQCVTTRVQALPHDLTTCLIEAGKLRATRIVKAAGADDRVKDACGH